MEFTKSEILILQNMLVLGYNMKNSAVAKRSYESESHIFFMTTSAEQTQGAWATKIICHCLLSLEKFKKCRSSCALQYGGQSIHWTDISSVINSRTADRFVSVSDMIDLTELENDGWTQSRPAVI
jgi:hypothetical protein